MVKKKFLVTGGTGFIGSHISRLLVNLGHKVTIFDNNTRGKFSRINDIRKKVKFISGDVRNKKKLFNAVKGSNAVIHLAYINGTKYFYSKPDLVLDVAVKGLVNIFDACKKYNIKEIYLASSSEVYQTPAKIPTDEAESLKIPDIMNPRYSYGGGKILTELMGINFGRKFFKKLIIFRPHNVYGNDMGNEHVIPEFMKRIRRKNKKNFYIEGTGNEIRSFIHIKDFLNAFKILLQKGKHLEIYNIGNSEKVRIIELAKMISVIMNIKVKIVKKPLKKGGTKVRVPDIQKITKLGFKNQITLKKGLSSLIE